MTLLGGGLKLSRCIQFVRRLSTEKPYHEVSIPVPWGEIRGKWWGPTDIRPILTLHGWQDNCGTFDRLIPLLDKDVGFLAIDMPGHGYSSHLPSGFSYNIVSSLLTIKYIVNYFQWPKSSFMGHSMGGITCYVYTMLYPYSVDFIACIDGLKPFIQKNRVGYMAKSIDDLLKIHQFSTNTDEPPGYTVEEIKKKMHAPNNGSISLDFAHYIMHRNVAPSKLHPGKYYFTRDPRLRSFDLPYFPQDILVDKARDVTCPIFITKSKQGGYFEGKENLYSVLNVLKENNHHCEYHYVEGTHHAVLNNPSETAQLLNKFFQKHNTGDRKVGGIKEEVIVTEEQDPRIKLNSYGE